MAVTQTKLPIVSKITTKGQVTIPKLVRDRLGVRVNDSLEFNEKDGEIIVRKHNSKQSLWTVLREQAKKSGHTMNTENILKKVK